MSVASRGCRRAARPRPGRLRRAAAWLALCGLLLLCQPALADSLAPVRRTPLPALAAPGALQGLAAVDGQAVAIVGGTPWGLDPQGGAWRPLRWRGGAVPARLAGLFGDGRRAYALLGTPQAVEGVARLRLAGDALSLQPLPPLPAPLAAARGALDDTLVYLAGRAGPAMRLLRLAPEAERPQWTAADGWPTATAATTLAAQGGALYATVPAAAGGRERLWRWTPAAGWAPRGALPGTPAAGAARALGQANLLYLLRGADGAVRPTTFQTITGAWAALPGTTAGDAAAAAAWRDGLLLATAAGDGRVAFASAQVQSGKLLLRWLDWLVIVAYLAAMIGIGLYFYLREKRGSTSSFFVGGRSIPFWAAGISLYAANTSSISFIAIPAKAFESNWQYLTNNLIAVFGLMFVAVWIVPLLRRLDLMSVFSYLETRFHPAIRMLASALCILTQLGSRMSVILFLPALAIATITGISVAWSVVLMGGFTIVYTAMGGMKAVIWTDVVQVIVKMGGAIFAIGFIVWHLHGGLGEFMATATAEHKMKLLDFSFDLTQATVWGFVILVLFDVVLTFPKDQVLMQRTLSTRSDREAGRSIWAFAAIMIPGGFVFYLIGTALFVYYKAHPERMNPLLPIDATFPLFIAAELPMGVTGLIVAGIFAAAMATLSGIMNSVATLISVDFYERLVKNPTQKRSVFFAELMTVAVGLVGIGLALLLSRFDVRSLFDVSIELAGLLGGGFAGAYTLGMFTRRANAPGVAIGIGASICLTLVAWWFKLVHPYFYLAISIFLCIAVGYLASLCFPPPRRSLKGLTIYADADD
ncbi:sodium:solute symporter [Fulvimonas soli]|jgi:SSS family transporter|uniref:SSS family transporter n=1 Tax=Fulvimonas soli TaxID=155197 RepID=A0A316IHV9_9GAMM|nr:sodium:solute symporter [Fulvimonas soli]PWK92450.1 SSS family transporter [Fulvimonas soli]